MDERGVNLGRGWSGKVSNVSKRTPSGRNTRRKFTSDFKAKVALSALSGHKTMAQPVADQEQNPDEGHERLVRFASAFICEASL